MSEIPVIKILTSFYDVSQLKAERIENILLAYATESTSESATTNTTNFLFLQKFFIILGTLGQNPQLCEKEVEGESESETGYRKIFGIPLLNYTIPQTDFNEILTTLKLPDDVWDNLFDFIETDAMTEQSCIALVEQLVQYLKEMVPKINSHENWEQKWNDIWFDNLHNMVQGWMTYSLLVAIDWLKTNEEVMKDYGIEWDMIFRHQYFRTVMYGKMNSFISSILNPIYGKQLQDTLFKTKTFDFKRIAFVPRIQMLLGWYEEKQQRLNKKRAVLDMSIEDDDYTKFSSPYKCKQCKLNHTGKIRRMQTRGADEPESVWYYCYKCKENFRYQ